LAHSTRGRGGARRLAPRGRLRSGGTPGAWPTRAVREPPIWLGEDRPSLRVPVRGAARLLSRAAGCAGVARVTGRLTPFSSTSRSPISQRLPKISNSGAAVLAL